MEQDAINFTFEPDIELENKPISKNSTKFLNNLFQNILKFFTKERNFYLSIGVILLLCIYFYIKYKKVDLELERINEVDSINKVDSVDNLKLLTDEFRSQNQELKESLNSQNLDLLNRLGYQEQKNSQLENKINDLIQLNQMALESNNQPEIVHQYEDDADSSNMNSYEDDNFTNTPVSDSIESSSILEQTFQNLRLDSDEEDERIKQQDLTATEIQSIQKQLNSMQS